MAGELTNAGADLLLNFLFRPGSTATRPTNIYLGLATASLSDTTTLFTVTEASDASYARQTVTSVFGAPADVSGVETVKNGSDISFNFGTGGVEITHAFLTDAASGTSGTIYAYWTLATAKTPGANDILKFATNNITFGTD